MAKEAILEPQETFFTDEGLCQTTPLERAEGGPIYWVNAACVDLRDLKARREPCARNVKVDELTSILLLQSQLPKNNFEPKLRVSLACRSCEENPDNCLRCPNLMSSPSGCPLASHLSIDPAAVATAEARVQAILEPPVEAAFEGEDKTEGE